MERMLRVSRGRRSGLECVRGVSVVLLLASLCLLATLLHQRSRDLTVTGPNTAVERLRGGNHDHGDKYYKEVYKLCMKQYITKKEKAAEKGDCKAAFDVAEHYASGDYVDRNQNKAVDLYEKAANLGMKEAQYKLASCLEQGNGVAKNEHGAANWYQKAAQNGHNDAKKALGRLYGLGLGVPKDEKKALGYFLKASEDK